MLWITLWIGVEQQGLVAVFITDLLNWPSLSQKD